MIVTYASNQPLQAKDEHVFRLFVIPEVEAQLVEEGQGVFEGRGKDDAVAFAAAEEVLEVGQFRFQFRAGGIQQGDARFMRSSQIIGGPGGLEQPAIFVQEGQGVGTMMHTLPGTGDESA